MNLEKAKKRIAKKAKMGLQGYPIITITYSGTTADIATEVAIELVMEDGAEAQVERFNTRGEAREDEVIQSAIVKMIERTGAKTVVQTAGVTLRS